ASRSCLVCWELNPDFPKDRSRMPGNNVLPVRVATVLPPTQYSLRRGCLAACTTARPATSGSYIGGTGWACLGNRDNTHENCGVLTAGICNMVTLTGLLSSSSSARKAS